jgi:predicted peroxiredoxin
MADPVSWLLIEPGWKVVDGGGKEIGRVEEVLGDSGADIFDGLSIASGIVARPRYVPSEQVAEIVEGTVKLSLDEHGVDTLAAYEEPAVQEEVESVGASAFTRAEQKVTKPPERPEQVGVVRRALEWLGLAGKR